MNRPAGCCAALISSVLVRLTRRHAGRPCTAACMYGTNMSARATVFDGDVRFNDNIGPDGSANYAMGSDTELALRLERAGHKCWFASAPLVEHIVPPKPPGPFMDLAARLSLGPWTCADEGPLPLHGRATTTQKQHQAVCLSIDVAASSRGRPVAASVVAQCRPGLRGRPAGDARIKAALVIERDLCE